MISLIKKVLVGLIVLPLFTLPSCIEDSLNNPCKRDKLVDVKMTITLPKPISKSVESKAYSTRTDYNTVNDINVFVFNSTGTTLLSSCYFPSGYTGTTPQPTIDPALPLISDPTTNNYATIHICDVEPTAKFYLIANYGSQITSVTNLTTLQNLKQTAANGIPTTCMMYAAATDNGGTEYVMEKKAELVRTLAMVTVEINGTNLKEDPGTTLADSTIKFLPSIIKLMHVPQSCVLGSDIDNMLAPGDPYAAQGDSSLVPSWGTVSRSSNSIVGGHGVTGIPLFQFENKQGNKSPSSTEENKTTTDKPNSSYLLVQGVYQLFVGGTLKLSGTIIYKFCLGSDVTTNFDVERNTHYAVTLNLSGWGGAMEDGHFRGGVIEITEPSPEVGWRVDLTLRDWGFLQDEYNFDSHASFSFIPVIGGGWNITQLSGGSWLKLLQKNKTSWLINPSGAAKYDDSGGNLKFYVMPWRFTAADDGTPYREIVLQVSHSSSEPVQTVKIRQWAPIKLETGLYMERFEESGDSVAWGYNGDPLTISAPAPYSSFTFGGTEANGWNNTRYLYTRNTTMSPAALRCMIKAGYDYSNILALYPGCDNPITSPSEIAAYYMPSKPELVKVIGYVADPSDPYQFFDPVKTNWDYWSSSAPSATAAPYPTFYWQGSNAIITTANRNDAKHVRSTYRPALNP